MGTDKEDKEDKELSFPIDNLKYMVVARPYTDDMTVQDKIYTKDEVVDMFVSLKSYIDAMAILEIDPSFAEGEKFCVKIIQQKIDALRSEKLGCEDCSYNDEMKGCQAPAETYCTFHHRNG